MADDIRLVIGVEQSGLLKAITNTEALEGKVKKLSAAYARDAASYGKYNTAVGKLAKATNRNKKELLAYGTALRADEKSTKKATAEVKAFTLARKQATAEDRRRTSEKKIAVKATEDLARAEAKNAASLKSMRMATDSVYRNQQKRLQMKKLLKSAIAAETMTTQQAIVALKRYNAAQMSSTKVMGAARNKMNGNNMAIQQLGYQFGDFAVQVQGGTSAFVAFSQQGAQLAGILPMIAGPLGLSMGAAVLLSAALGILIPIGSAVGRMFFEMRDSSDEAGDKIESFEDKLKAARETTKSMAEALELLKSGFDNIAKKTLSEELEDATAELVEAQRDLDAKADTAMRVSLEQMRANNITDRSEEALQALAEGFRNAAMAASPLLSEAQARVDLAEKELGIIQELADEKADRAYSALLDKVTKSQNDQIALAAMILATNKDHLEVAKLRATQEGISKGLIGDELDQYVLMEEVLRNLLIDIEDAADATASSAKEAERLAAALKEAASAMSSLLNTGSLESKLAGLVAETKAIKSGADSASASLMASELVKVTKERDTALMKGELPSSFVNQAYANKVGLIEEVGAATANRNAARDAARPSSGGGGGGGNDFSQDEYLNGLTDEAKFKHTLVRLSAEQVTEAERRRQIIMKIQSEGKVAEEGRIKTILETEAATRKAIAAEEQRQTTMDMVTDNIENAFMSIVDGSKSVEDAFKSMLRNIILEIYQQQVAQPAATAIGGFLKNLLFQADGGAFSGGSQIQAYANGGVVGGPTTFPMSGGKTGLMGEAGPEAIMPLKRGSNGKLGVQMEGGGGGDVININQSFNFQANGDDSVKKLIAQAAPKIADMAKASVIESRRRGGSTKAAFG